MTPDECEPKTAMEHAVFEEAYGRTFNWSVRNHAEARKAGLQAVATLRETKGDWRAAMNAQQQEAQS